MNLHMATHCSNILRVQPNYFAPFYSLCAEAASSARGSAAEKNQQALRHRFCFRPHPLAL